MKSRIILLMALCTLIVINTFGQRTPLSTFPFGSAVNNNTSFVGVQNVSGTPVDQRYTMGQLVTFLNTQFTFDNSLANGNVTARTAQFFDGSSNYNYVSPTGITINNTGTGFTNALNASAYTIKDGGNNVWGAIGNLGGRPGIYIKDAASLYGDTVTIAGTATGRNVALQNNNHKRDTAVMKSYTDSIANLMTFGTITDITAGWGTICTPSVITNAGNVKLDSGTIFPEVLSSLAAGYGMLYGSRTYVNDTGTIFPRMALSMAAGYGLLYGSRTFTSDTGTIFPKVLSSIAAGYGLLYGSRTYTSDTGTLFTKYASTEAAGYGMFYSSRTYTTDTGTLFTKFATTQTGGYGILYGTRTFKEDTGTTFAAIASSFAAGYGVLFSSRTYKEDTATTFAKITSTFAAGYGILYGSRTFTNDTGTIFPKIATSFAAGWGLAYGTRNYKFDSATVLSFLRANDNYRSAPSNGAGSVGTTDGTQTLTNKRVNPRVGSTTSSATPTINTDNYDVYKLTAQAANITSMTTNLTGTPVDGNMLELEVTGTGSYTITWGSSFVSSSVTLPTSITTTTLTIVLEYFTTSSYGNNKWICVNYF